MTQYRQPRGRFPPRMEQRQPTYPTDYLRGSYFDDKGNIKCDLLTGTAESLAKDFGYSGITSTQLRRFFIQVRAIERQLGQKEFPELVPSIQGLRSLVANYVGRGKNTQERQRREYLKRFIDDNVALATRDEKHFKKGFVPHFESIVAYFKYHFPSRD